MKLKLGVVVTVLIALCSLQTVFAVTQDQYYNDRISVYFYNDLGEIQLTGTKDQVRTGYAEFDALIEKYQVSSMAKRLTAATAEDRDDDIYLNRFYTIRFDKPSVSLSKIMEDFRNTGYVTMVERVEINRVAYTPNDPQYASQWFLPQIYANRAWDLWTDEGNIPGDSTIVVGIVDTGVQWDHPDLVENLWQNLAEDADGDGATIEYVNGSWQLDQGDLDDTDADGNGYVDDLIGWDPAGVTSSGDADNDPMGTPGLGDMGAHMHGTHVSGIVAATSDNNTGVASVGFSVSYMPVKCTYDEDPDDYVSSGYDGILYAAKAGAHVINMSWGGYGYSGFAQSVVNTAHNQYGAILVGAAGNEATTQAHYPSGYDNVISVTALGTGDSFNGWATRGATVDLSAPGESIRSTIYTDYGSYTSYDGTSMAAPVVAGAVGLFWSMFPDSSQAFIEERIVSSADNIDALNPNYAGEIGEGRVNVYKAIASRWLPNLMYANHSVIVSNDDDGMLNPGESATMRVVLQNEAGWATATGVTATLASPDPEVTVTDGAAEYNDISPGNSGVNVLDTFGFEVSADARIGTLPFTMTVTGGDAPYTFEYTFNFDVEIGLNQAGFPFDVSASIQTSPLLYDLDGDGEQEIIAGSDNYNLYVLNADGSMREGFPYLAENQIRGSAAVGDVDNNGAAEIVVASKDNYIYILNADGTVMQKYQTGGYLMSTPALADLDGNGDLEIVANSFDRNLYVINHDSTAFPGFPVSLDEPLMTAPAIGDLDNNDTLDIVVGTWSNNVYAVDITGTVLDGFPFTAGNKINSDPSLTDLDGNGTLEIAVGSDDNHLYILDDAGNVLVDYTANGFVRSAPNFYDIDSDGSKEIFFGSSAGRLYAIHADGQGVAGYPVEVDGGVFGGLIFADLDSDGSPEILFGTSAGLLEIRNLDGTAYGDFPINVQSAINNAVAVGFLDADADLEVVYGTTSAIGAVDIKSAGSLENLESIYRGDAQRSGWYNAGDSIVSIAQEQSLPVQISLEANYPNPFNPTTQISYTIPAKTMVNLTVYDLRGSVITTLVNAVRPQARHTVTWDGTNQNGRPVASGVYFYILKAHGQTLSKKMVLIR